MLYIYIYTQLKEISTVKSYSMVGIIAEISFKNTNKDWWTSNFPPCSVAVSIRVLSTSACLQGWILNYETPRLGWLSNVTVLLA